MACVSGPSAIHACSRLESSPPWTAGTTDDEWDGTWLDVEVSSEALITAAGDLMRDLAHFPQR